MKKIKISITKEALRVLKSAEVAKIVGGTADTAATDTCLDTRDCVLPPS